MTTTNDEPGPRTSIEAEIRVRLWERSLPYVRQTLIAASVLFLVFLAWDVRVDRVGEVDTVVERVVASAFFAVSYLLVAFTRFGRAYLGAIYVVNVLMATAFLLWIFLQVPDAYMLAHSSFLAVTMVVMAIGPTLAYSVPLVLASLGIPNLVVFLCLGLGIELPGLPDAGTAINLAWIHFAVGAVAVVLVIVHTRLQRRIIIDNVHLEQLADTDPLTSIPNRRQLESEFGREQARQRRHDRTMAVLELDIDHFKQVNDTRGHGVGDEVLRALSQRWRELIREIDVLARVGGEEFVLLLPETGEEGARETAERLRAGTETEAVPTSAGDLPITVSIGVTLVPPGGGGLDVAIERVDQALYKAKRGGRNRCEFLAPEAVMARSGNRG